jgi:pimeloyl-ACP methyl ester carboxylesterase
MDDGFEGTVRSTSIELSAESGLRNKVHIRRAGQRSTPQDPTIVFVCGLGSSCLSFTVVQHELAAAGISSFTYDRLGIGRSSPLLQVDNAEAAAAAPETPQPRHAKELAKELSEVLRVAGVLPPFIIASHSYGGVISWEYIAAHAGHVVGFLAIDANSARSIERPLNDQDLGILTKGLADGAFDYYKIVGLNAANRLPSALWEEATSKRHPTKPWQYGTGGEVSEMQGYSDSCKSLQRHGILSRHPLTRYPVTVIKGDTAMDIRRLIDASEALGGGTHTAHEDLRKKLEGYSQIDGDQQSDHLQLTGCGTKRYIESKRSGHWVHITEPELVVHEILKMINEVARVI